MHSLPQQYFILGDSGFGITPSMMTPYSDSEIAYNQRRAAFIYNFNFARVRIEQLFGILNRMFPYLVFPRQCKEFAKHTEFVKTLLIIYNILMDLNEINTANIRSTVEMFCSSPFVEQMIGTMEQAHRDNLNNGGYNYRDFNDDQIRNDGQQRRDELVQQFIDHLYH